MDATLKTHNMVTSSEVQEIRFPLVRRGGYDPKQVDPFLAVIASRLDAGANGDPNINAQFVHETRFNTVRRGGYSAAAVDSFLDRVIDTLDPPAANAEPADDEAPPRSVSAGEAATVWSPSTSPPSPAPPAPAPAPAPAPTNALDEGRANLERLRVLYDAGLLSDKELAVLARRVKRLAREQSETTNTAG